MQYNSGLTLYSMLSILYLISPMTRHDAPLMTHFLLPIQINKWRRFAPADVVTAN